MSSPRLYAARVHGGNAPENCIDFSAPMNPLAPPPFLVHELLHALHTVVRYPDPSYRKLVEALAEIHGIEAPYVVPLNGAAEGYTLLIACLRPRRVVILEPTFGDRDIEAMCVALGIDVVHVAPKISGSALRYSIESLEDLGLVEGDMLVLSDPCNPAGFCLDQRERRILENLASDALIVVDEAFKTLTRCSPFKPRDGVVVLRSLTKELGVPGLRIGFLAISDERLYRVLDACRQPWNVNSLASYIVTRIAESYLEDYRAFLEHSRQYIESERQWLHTRLGRLPSLRVFGSDSPYLLVEHRALTHPDMQRRLVERGVYVRDCTSFYGLGPRYSRISVRLRHENEILVEALEEVLRWC